MGVSNAWAARTFKSGQKIYFKDAKDPNLGNSTWKVSDDNGNVYAYFWNDSENGWSTYGNCVSGNWNSENAIYEFTVPGTNKTYTKMLFTRGTAASWENNKTWNQTGDQTPDEGQNLFYVTSGTWGAYAKNGAIVGTMNNWNPDTNPLSSNKVTISLNYTSATSYDFKVLYGETYYGTTNAISGTVSNQVFSTSGNNCTLNLVVASTSQNYTFTWDDTNKKLSVTYPTSHTVTYSQTPAAAANVPTTSPSVTSSKKVASGTSVTFTAQTAITGYTWKGWYDNNAGTGTALSTNKAYTRSITANTTIYAVYTPNTTTIKLWSDGKLYSSIKATYNSNILEPKITNPTKDGHSLEGWHINSNLNKRIIDTDGKLIAGVVNGVIEYTDDNGNWKNISSDLTFYAKWTPEIYSITYKDQGDKAFSGTHAANYPTTHTYDIATSLKSATKPGYTFDGWYTTSDCTGSPVNSLAAKTYTDNITLYAKWTIKQYTLNFSGDGGTVTATAGGQPITSPATINHGTSVSLTATPSGENAFAQWVDGDDVKVSTNNPYTFTITSDKTVKAVFSKPTTVYLKPSDAWKEYNAHFAIYAWGKFESWVEMEEVDCEGDYYKANVPAGFSDFAFVRLKPVGADGYNSENDGHNWDNKWDQTGNLTVQTNGKNMYDIDDKTVSYIHLKPNNNWKSDEARFAAYFFNNTGNKWVNLTLNGDVYTCKKPAGYTSVIFCRMKPGTSNGWGDDQCWNKTKDLTILNDGSNCFSINQDDWGCSGSGDGNANGANGEWFRVLDDSQWKAYSTPTYDVTIKPTIHGTYSVVCNGRTYPVSYKEDIVIPDVAVGTVLTIQDVKPNKETEYTSDIIYKESTNAKYQTLGGNQITVCGNTTIDENFVTTNEHVVYLRIPNSLADWKTGNNQKLSVYNKLTESYELTPMTAAPNASNYETGYTYYTCTIPRGTHTIRFEYINGNTKYQTHDFPHVMPLGSLNCYTIHSREGDTKVFNGYWSELLSNGDYRLLYVEQTVEKDANNKTIINRRKAHPSDIIPANIITGNGSKVVSLHIYKDRMYTDAVKKYDGATPTYYESYSNPEVILQQYNCSTKVWEDKERHMVFGPLKTLPGMAMAPGRRNTAATATLVYDNGINAIKNDQHADQGSGVWNFTIKKKSDSNIATIDLTNVTRYIGEYYIRTDVANGGWFNYNPTNHMTRSDEAKANSNFSHYYCKWIESDNNVNVKFTVANDYGYAISDTLEADRTDLWGVALANKMVGDNQTLPKNANVRFAWNEYSNFIHRAYIAGSAVVSDRFLVLEGDANIFDATGSALNVSGLKANEQIFRDNSNWIYYADVQMKPNAPVKVTAKYNDQTQYFVGKQNETVSLLQGSGSEKYLIRMLYDFKTNQLLSAYVPGGSDKVNAISTNLMLIRKDNNPATQLVFNNDTPHDMETIPSDRKAYGVIEFTKKRLINGLDENDEPITELEKGLYWISFPFDVDLSQVICFGEYGKHWVIEEYDGARRAAEGCWLESESFWIYHWDQNITLQAGKGYVIGLDVDLIKTDNLFGLAGDRPIGIYFPSESPVDNSITDQTKVTTYVEPHECKIWRNTPKGDRRIADSHWNVVGVPSYINAIGNYKNFTANIDTKPEELKYYYEWGGEYNSFNPVAAETQTFYPLYSYMVQYAGYINWTSIRNEGQASLAAKKNSDGNQLHRLCLEIQQNGDKVDQTFVRLEDEDGVTDRFDFNHDLCKIVNAGANIYSFVTTETYPIEVAANVLPIQETIIPIGIKLDAAGEYTFAMPDGTDGIVVELIDYETNTTTNLLLDNYTVNLGKGTFENRFALHVQPSKVTTSVGEINTNTTGVKKYLIDGVLYMQKDGVLYDAQGRKL